MNKINLKFTFSILLIGPGFLILSNFLPQERRATFSTLSFIINLFF